LRRIRAIVDRVLEQLSPRFNRLYARAGLPSIAPEKLLRTLLLQLLYSVRREPLLMEQLNYNLLFRWFVGLSMDDAVWDASTFSRNREEDTTSGSSSRNCDRWGSRRMWHRARMVAKAGWNQRTTRHPVYEASQRKRKRIEEVFGWMQTVGMLRQLRHRGLERVGWVFTLAAAATT
jgi:hypothetical protein